MKGDSKFNIRVGLPPQWQTVARINQAVQCYSRVLFSDETVADSVAMVCTELLENAVKYSDTRVDSPHRIRLEIVGDDVSISVNVCNSAKTTPENAQALYQMIYRIKAAESTQQAYMDRMEEVFSGLSSGSGLGLVRIAYEGGCDLDCEVHDDGSVEVRALFKNVASEQSTGDELPSAGEDGRAFGSSSGAFA